MKISFQREYGFSPSKKINIVQKIGAYVLGFSLAISTFSFSPAQADFSDLPGHWSAPYVDELANMGIISTKNNDGTPKQNYFPNNSLTRAELTKLAIEAFYGDTVEDLADAFADANNPSFSDVAPSEWYFDYVEIAKGLDIVGGFEDGTFKPHNPISRAGALKVVLLTGDIETKLSPAVSFVDVNGHWANELITTAYNHCMVKGTSSREFSPNGNMTRGEAAKILSNAITIVNGDRLCSDTILEDPDEDYANEDYADDKSIGTESIASGENLGFSVGGAKDADNFRENIEYDYLPTETDITYEGLFYDYYFNTGQKQECTKLFCPSFSKAVSPDPFSEKDEYYLSVGLNSNIKKSDFERKKLNIVMVLDVSGSMSGSFSQYYYDGNSNRVDRCESYKEEKTAYDSCVQSFTKTKMQIQNETVANIADLLNDDDRLGIVHFDGSASLKRKITSLESTDREALRKEILSTPPQGGTNWAAGMAKGIDLFDELSSEEMDMNEYENRIIFLTDAMPNMGETRKEGLFGLSETAAGNKIHTSFIGVGIDFNTELVEYVTKIRGANYFSIHSSDDFQKRLNDEFDYLVTPLVFGVNLNLISDSYEIEKVFGSPEADAATGELMKINTLFPSEKSSSGETRGGLVLIKLKKKENATDGMLYLKTTYEDRNGNIDSDKKAVRFDETEETFDNTGIQKGILLTRYAGLMKQWIRYERSIGYVDGIEDDYVFKKCGTEIDTPEVLQRWERQSTPLRVTNPFGTVFDQFKTYMEEQNTALQDEDLPQEFELLEKLIGIGEAQKYLPAGFLIDENGRVQTQYQDLIKALPEKIEAGNVPEEINGYTLQTAAPKKINGMCGYELTYEKGESEFSITVANFCTGVLLVTQNASAETQQNIRYIKTPEDVKTLFLAMTQEQILDDFYNTGITGIDGKKIIMNPSSDISYEWLVNAESGFDIILITKEMKETFEGEEFKNTRTKIFENFAPEMGEIQNGNPISTCSQGATCEEKLSCVLPNETSGVGICTSQENFGTCEWILQNGEAYQMCE